MLDMLRIGKHSLQKSNGANLLAKPRKTLTKGLQKVAYEQKSVNNAYEKITYETTSLLVAAFVVVAFFLRQITKTAV